MDRYSQLFFDLQFFGEEKTEEATPKRKEDARKEGQIVKSQEVNAVGILLIAFLMLRFFNQYLIDGIQKMMKKLFQYAEKPSEFFNENNQYSNFLNILTEYFLLIGPMIAALFIAALIVNYLQVGFLFTTKPLKPKLEHISPMKGFKRIFSKRAIVELIKSILKILLIGYVAIVFIQFKLPEIINQPVMSIKQYLETLNDVVFSVIIRIILVLISLAAMDYFFKWKEHKKNLRMSKKEIKEEYKQTEGDPQLKGKIKEKQRQMAMGRMMQQIAKADVIITNPTHYAVAIKYDSEKYDAPYVVGKGMDFIAQRIKQTAQENGVPIVENKLLARTLYETVEIGYTISEDLYEAVAEILAYIYNLNQ